MKLYHTLTLAAVAGIAACTAQAQTTINFAASSDLTNSFREARSNTNDAWDSGTGSDGAAGFFRFTGSADSGALRYVYDANGSTAGESTYTAGYVAMDVKFAADNVNMGLFLSDGSSLTDTVGYRVRMNNSGSSENSAASFGINQTNNFSSGTTLTTTSTPAVVSSSGLALNAGSTSIWTNTTLTSGSWMRMRMDFSVDGSNQRVVQFRVWDNITETGSALIDQTITLTAGYYTSAGQVGFWTIASGATVDIDNFTVGTPVPEPSTYAAIFGLGALGFAAWRRRRVK